MEFKSASGKTAEVNMMNWVEKDRGIGYCYDNAQFAAALAECGLMPTPLPELPLHVDFSYGRTIEARRATDSRIVVRAFRGMW